MTYRGHIESGKVVLDEAVSLPEGGQVLVELLVATPEVKVHPEVLRMSGIFPPRADIRGEYYEALSEKHQ